MTWVRVAALLDIFAVRLAARKPVFWDRAAGESAPLIHTRIRVHSRPYT
jgi:hypothetical protein